MTDPENQGEKARTPLSILFTSLALPFPPNNGQRLRNWGILRALAEEGHEITLLSFAEPKEFDQDLTPLRKICREVALVPSPLTGKESWRAHWGRLAGLFSPLPFGVIRYRSPAMESAIRDLIEQRRFDALVCDNIYQFRNFPDSVHRRLLLNKHDFTFVIIGRLLSATRNIFKLAYGWTEYYKLRRWEMQVCGQAARVLVCSELDARILREALPDAPASVVPNVIDVTAYQPRDEDDGRTLLFFGAMDYHANADAVEFFLSRILPEIKRTNPGVRFVVAGRNPPDSLRRRHAGVPGVEFTGTVADMQGEIARATVCVVPLRIGSGTRLKILEAAAMKKAVVSTPVGAEGLGLEDGQGILLAEEPREFAQAVCELLSDPRRRRALGEAARNKVEESYSLGALRRSLRESLIEFRAAPSPAASGHALNLARERARA